MVLTFRLTTKKNGKWETIDEREGSNVLDDLKKEGIELVESGECEFVNIVTVKPWEVVWRYGD